MPLLGSEGYLYFDPVNLIDQYPGGAGSIDYGTAALRTGLIDIDDAIDITPDSSTEKTATTTRKTARQGKKSEKTVTSGGTIVFTVSSEHIAATSSMLFKLLKAANDGDRVSMFDLNGHKDTVGVWGQCGLYELSKPVATKSLSGHQVLSIEATLQDWPASVIVINDPALAFTAFNSFVPEI